MISITICGMLDNAKTGKISKGMVNMNEYWHYNQHSFPRWHRPFSNSLTFNWLLIKSIFYNFLQNSLTFHWPWKYIVFTDFFLTTGYPGSISLGYLIAFRLRTMPCSCVQCPWNISAQTSIPPPQCASLHTMVMPAFHSPVQHLPCRPSALWSRKPDSS